MNNLKTEWVHCSYAIPKELKAKVVEACEASRLSVNKAIRWLLEDFVSGKIELRSTRRSPRQGTVTPKASSPIDPSKVTFV